MYRNMMEFDSLLSSPSFSSSSTSSNGTVFPVNNLLNNNDSSQPMAIPSVAEGENDDGMSSPPEHLFSDYIEITYLGAVIIAGLALNFWVLNGLWREKMVEERSGRPKNGFVLLKLNLNISDLLILLIHASGKFGWLITYEWRGGEHLCRLFNFLSMFTLYLSSNIVICIALDRLMTVLKAQKINTGNRKLNLIRFMLAIAWTMSILFSIPQLFVWTTYNPFRNSQSQGWVQCTDIWSIDRYERYLEEQSGKQEMAKTNGTTNEWTKLVLNRAVQNGYELTHLFLVFYGPLIVLVFCYALISTRLIRFAANNPRNNSQQATSQGQENGGPVPSTIASDGRHRHLLNYKRASIKSFPAVRLYAPLGDRKRRKSHHQVPMIDIHEVSTRAEETTTCSTEHSNSQILFKKMSKTKAGGGGQQLKGNADGDCLPSTALLLNGQRASNNSLPIYYGLHPDRKEISDEDLLAKSILIRCSNVVTPNGTAPSGCLLHSMSSNSSLSTAVLQPKWANGSTSSVGGKRRILVRIRNSFRNSIGRRLRAHSPSDGLKSANLALHCSAASLKSVGDHQSPEHHEKRKPMAPFFPLWKICCGWNIWRRQKSGENGQHEASATSICGIVPQNGCCHRQSAVNNHSSIRSSFSTTATLGPRHSLVNPAPPLLGNRSSSSNALPLWRRHLRSRAFRATLFVILAHVLLWSPYNVYALMKHVNEQLYERMSEQANVLKDLQFLIVLINPFLYGFGQKMKHRKGEEEEELSNKGQADFRRRR